MENEKNQCTKCGGQGEPSKALRNYHHVDKSYLRGEVEFETKLLDCIKCTSCGHSWVPEETTRQLAITWIKSLSDKEQIDLYAKYNESLNLHGRAICNLTDSEIEKIWLKEHADYQKSDTEFVLKEMQHQSEERTAEQHSYKSNDSFTREKNTLKRIANATGLKPNQKQFKEVSPTLVKAYLDKFSQEGKAEILSILIKDLGVVNLVDPSLIN
jgi:hypothetical protein